MDILTWILLVVATIGLAYSVQWAGATLIYGRKLANSDSGTGFQDAITPPWLTNFSLVFYIAFPTFIGLIWWHSGFLSALIALVSAVGGLFVSRAFLPKPTSNHYRRMILRSMARRYSDYVRDGDSVRAEAMKTLLVKAGVDPDGQGGT